MTSQTGKNRYGWRRAATGAVASSAIAVGLMTGFGSPAALADPETDPQADAPPTAQPDVPQTAEEVLAIIEADYDLGSGGGQLSNLIDDVMRLRAQGFYPSNANKEAIVKALEYRPNQGPLIEALRDTLVYQRKMQARSAAQPSNPFVIGVDQLPPGVEPGPTDPGNGGGFFISPGGAPPPPLAP
ncbi:MAG: hypothetical protein ABWY20_10490 [Mycobacterium sp.]